MRKKLTKIAALRLIADAPTAHKNQQRNPHTHRDRNAGSKAAIR